MIHARNRAALLAGGALLLTGCHDSEVASCVTATLGLAAAVLAVVRGMRGGRRESDLRGLGRRLRSGTLLFVAGLLLGGGVTLYLFVGEDFTFETALARASERIQHVGEEHEHPGDPHDHANDSDTKLASTHNWLVARVACPACAATVDITARFKYGDSRLDVYRIGEEIRWGTRDVGTRTDERVWVRAWTDGCPHCRESVLEFAMRVERNRIADIEPVADDSVWRGRNWVLGESLE